jgi:hypothetical protein
VNSIVRCMIGSTSQGKNPLLVNAVQSDTNLKQYLPVLRRWVEFCDRNGMSLEDTVSRDNAMADWFAELCYKECRHPSIGKSCLSGYSHVYPEHAGKMPLAARSLKSWRKLFKQLEREPLPEELLMVLIVSMICEGEFEESAAYAMHFDGVMREQDIFQADCEDFVHMGGTSTLTLGRVDRGETVKTGVDQGIEFTTPWVVKIIRGLVRGRRRGKVFRVPKARYQSGFTQWLQKYRVPPQRGVYVWRHSGAAARVRAALRRKENMSQVMDALRRRGRWASMTALQVYTKTHLLNRILAQLDEEVLRWGSWLIAHQDEVAEVWVRCFEEAGRPLYPRAPTADVTRGHDLRAPSDYVTPEDLQLVDPGGESADGSGIPSLTDGEEA